MVQDSDAHPGAESARKPCSLSASASVSYTDTTVWRRLVTTPPPSHWSFEVRLGYPLVTEIAPSPDGQSIAFLMAEPPSEEKKARKAKDDAIQWDQDFDFAHLFVVPFAVGPRKRPEARQITRGRYTVVDFDWLPDGSALALTHRPNP